MRSFTLLAILAALSGPFAVSAAELTFEHRARLFAEDRYDDVRTLLNGPRQSTPPPIDPAAGCVALYERRVSLQRTMNDQNPAYWDDPRNQTAVFLGTMWSPAFYFLGYSAITEHLDTLSNTDPRAEIDALRQASAALRCFEK
jgi:hypothetical protein